MAVMRDNSVQPPDLQKRFASNYAPFFFQESNDVISLSAQNPSISAI
jgi:hypothetical protein